MSGGIRAEVQILPASPCPIVEAADGFDVDGVSQAITADGDRVTEFVTGGSVADAEKIFEYGHEAVYRVRNSGSHECICSVVESLGYPVRERRVRQGSVLLSFYAPDLEGVQSVVETLSDRGDAVSVRRLTRSGNAGEAELVLVDRGELTGRQQQVLQRAHDLGYFDHPKGANAGEVARDLGIATATFTEHLSAAQRKLLDAVLG